MKETGGMFPEWYAEQFKTHPEFLLPLRMRTMHRKFGIKDGATCGGCKHFERYHQSTTWFKCALTKKTSGAATDWRARWPACGKWEVAEE
jgi:hypothetical protein